MPVLSQRRAWAAPLVLAAALAAGLIAQPEQARPAAEKAKPVSKVRTWRMGGGIKVARQSFRMTQPDEKRRLVVRCPKRRFPLGGAMTASPPPGPDGEGVYPHSYERLGRQRAWHVTAVLYDPSRSSTRTRRVTVQVVCGRHLGHVTPPHTHVYVSPGQTQTATARCPGRRHLFSGGFQRTDFTSRGGDFVTEARAVDSKTWRVTGHAFGGFGGELTAIAYCTRSKRPLLREVSGSTLLSAGALGTASTPRCPKGRRMTAGGFSSHGSTSTYFGDGRFTRNGLWQASGYAGGGSTGFSAFGYCLKA
ncbi:MAG: hypothetical protein ACXWF9_03575 [Solirubrobacterales bacterium]